jgi:DNA-binding GntR family transcriptional regulator
LTLNNSSLADQAYTSLKKDIITCALEPGSQMAQAQLVERYHFGLTPIREALKRLESEGYVQSIPRFGYLVSPITLGDINNIYELRKVLEVSAVRFAALRASDSQLRHIRESANFTYRYKDTQSYLDFLQENTAFHTQVALASGNARLSEMIGSLLDMMTRIFHLGLDLRDSAEEMRQEHIALATALQARDPIESERIVMEQISRSQQRVVERLSQWMIERASASSANPPITPQTTLKENPQ